MRDGPFLEAPPQPGQLVAWRHPRMAFALGRFQAYGPGPFEVVEVVPGERGTPSAVVVRTTSGEQTLDAAWLGPLPNGRGEPTRG